MASAPRLAPRSRRYAAAARQLRLTAPPLRTSGSRGRRRRMPGAPRARARSRAAARRDAPSCERTGRCRTAAPVTRAFGAEPRPFGGSPASATIALGERRRIAPRRPSRRRVPARARPCSPSASVETIGFPIASASSTVSGVPSHSDGNTTRSSADSAAATSRWNPANTSRSPEPERSPPAPRARPAARPRPTMKMRASGSASTTVRRRLDQILVALRRHQPRDRCRSRTSPARCRARAARRRDLRALRGRLNSSSGTPR